MKEETTTQHDQPAPEPMPAKKGGKVWMVLTIILALALIGMGIYGYIKFKDLNNQITAQQTEISNLQNTKKTLEDAASAAATAATNAAAKAVGNAISSQTDKDMIEAAIKADCAQQNAAKTEVGPTDKTFNIKSISGNYAQASFLCTGANEGPETILVKSNGNWVIVAKGIGEFVPAKVRAEYNIPSTLPKF